VPGGNLHDQLIGGVVGQGVPASVHAGEGDERVERQPFVAIDQRMIPGQRMQQRRCLGIQSR
jgi:hypothetical protein